MSMLVLPEGTIFKVRCRLERPKPLHWQGIREASLLDGRLGIIVIREETPDWMQIYRCLVGKYDISLGLGWIQVEQLPPALVAPVLDFVPLDLPGDLKG